MRFLSALLRVLAVAVVLAAPLLAPLAVEAQLLEGPYPGASPIPPSHSRCNSITQVNRTEVSDGLLWHCALPTLASIGAGQVSFQCQWVIIGVASPDTGSSDFRHVAPAPRSFTKLHVGLVNRQWGAFGSFSDMTVLNRISGDAEGRDPYNMALLHDLIVYNRGTGQWEPCGQSGWYYNTQYHYFMALALNWGPQPPCGAGRYYFNSGWSWQHEAGVSYYGNTGSGVLYAPHGAQQFRAATEADAAGAGPVPAPPSEDLLSKRKPPKPDKDKAKAERRDSPAVNYNVPV